MTMPRYAQDAIYGATPAPTNNFNKTFGTMMGITGATGLMSNLFGGDPSKPYKDAMKQMEQYTNQAAGYQNPFYNMGTAAIPQYQQYLSKMSDPVKFINDISGQYQTSPYEQYQQDQAMRAANNMASATGMTGSTPLMLQEQENAENIANKYMETWLQDVLGINRQYGRGLETELGIGQTSANQLSRMYQQLGAEMAKGAFGSASAKNNQSSDIFGDIGDMAMGAALTFL